MKVAVERAQKADGPVISEILSLWIDETPWMPRVHTKGEDKWFGPGLIAKMDVWVAKNPENVIGFMARRRNEIHSLYVSTFARGQGIGRALLDQAKLAQPNLELWAFQANLGARRFYARNGFFEDYETDGQGNDEKLPDVHLIWARKEQ